MCFASKRSGGGRFSLGPVGSTADGGTAEPQAGTPDDVASCKLHSVNPFEYLIALQKHTAELAKNPTAWMPWNYCATLQQASTSKDAA